MRQFLSSFKTVFTLAVGYTCYAATAEILDFNEPHSPRDNAKEAFNVVLHVIKSEVIKSRHHWDKHEPKMWSRAAGVTDHALTDFTIEKDLVLVRFFAFGGGGLRKLKYQRYAAPRPPMGLLYLGRSGSLPSRSARRRDSSTLGRVPLAAVICRFKDPPQDTRSARKKGMKRYYSIMLFR